MQLTRKDLVCRGVAVKSGETVEGWYVEGNVLPDGEYERKRTSYIIETYPDLRKTSIGCVYMSGFVEVIPDSVTLAEISNE